MTRKIVNIIKSFFIKEKGLPEWRKKRLQLCNGCEYNFKNKKHRKPKDYLMFVLNFFSFQCTICHCSVKRKTKIADEFCALEHIGKQPKWDIEE